MSRVIIPFIVNKIVLNFQSLNVCLIEIGRIASNMLRHLDSLLIFSIDLDKWCNIGEFDGIGIWPVHVTLIKAPLRDHYLLSPTLR